MGGLSQNDLRVLTVAQLQATCSLSEIARQAGMKLHTVRSSLERLYERKILFPYAIVNFHAFGYMAFKIFFALSSASSRSHATLRRTLMQSGRVAWLAEFGGDFQYGVAIYVRSTAELDEFLTSLTDEFGIEISRKSVALNCAWFAFRCKYLYGGKAAVESVAIFPDVAPQSIDELDHQILAGLSELRHRTNAELARSVGAPLTTIDYRIKQLEKRGIIQGFVYRVDSIALGAHVYRALLLERGRSSAFAKALNVFSQKHRNIVGLIRCIGSWDYELRLEFEDAAEVALLREELLEKFEAHLLEISVLPVFQTLKMNHYPFKQFPG